MYGVLHPFASHQSNQPCQSCCQILNMTNIVKRVLTTPQEMFACHQYQLLFACHQSPRTKFVCLSSIASHQLSLSTFFMICDCERTMRFLPFALATLLTVLVPHASGSSISSCFKDAADSVSKGIGEAAAGVTGKELVGAAISKDIQKGTPPMTE